MKCNAEIKAQLMQQLADKGLSNAKAAPLIGVSPAALSQYLNGTYRSNPANLEGKIAEFLRAQDAREEMQEKAATYQATDNYVPTSISEDVYKTIQYCQLEKGMVIIHGDAGIGKTKGVQRYIQDYPTNTLYINATPAIGSLTGMIRCLARHLKVTDTLRRDELSAEICDRLRSADKLIIIDEAQHLAYDTLEELRAYVEPDILTGRAHTGIVLVGNTEVYTRMLGKQEARFAQLFSRVKFRRHATTDQVTPEDVAKLFPLLREQGMKKEQRYMLGICRSKWGIRGAVNVYTNAVNNEAVNLDGLVAMSRQMGIGCLPA